jgi:hypothetical protein
MLLIKVLRLITKYKAKAKTVVNKDGRGGRGIRGFNALSK